MKKFLAVATAVVLSLSCFATSAFAASETTTSSGFDYYSLTVHYETPVVVGYKLVDKQYVWADAQDTNVIPVAEYAIKDSEGNILGNQILQKGDSVLKKDGAFNKLFYSIKSSDLNIDSSELSINENFGLVNITDKTAISIISSATLYGATDLYDEAGTPNPNFTYSNGYFEDASVDEEGNHNRIDANGYIVDKNNVWHTSDGHRVEPFVEVDGTLVWLPISSRLDENGVVMNTELINNKKLLELGVLSSYPEEYQNIDEEFQENKDYDGDGVYKKTKDKKAWQALIDERTTWENASEVCFYVIDYMDTNGDGKKNNDDMAEYNNPDRVFTEEDILEKETKAGLTKIFGTPEMGTPSTKAKITSITCEIDAMGTQLYADVASDPQQKNEIVITTGDLYDNIKTAEAYVAEHPEKVYTEGSVIGTAKCVTTKTEVTTGEKGYPSTVKSVEVTLEENAEIPMNANLFIQFNVAENQTEHEVTLASKSPALLSINKAAIDVEKLEDAETEEAEEEESKGCKSVIGGGAAVIATAMAAVVVFRKKEEI